MPRSSFEDRIKFGDIKKERLRLLDALRKKRFILGNKDRFLANKREWRRRNTDKEINRVKRWRSKNPEKLKASCRAWALRNSERMCFYANKRRAQFLNRIHPEHDNNIEILMHSECERLQKETGVKHHLDHIIPLSRNGWHHHLNMQVLPAPINQSKSNAILWMVGGYKSWRDVPEFLWPENLKEIFTNELSKS